MWHRGHGCPATEAFRSTEISTRHQQRAEAVRAQGFAAGEAFAQGLFPDPVVFTDRREPDEEDLIRWHNKPENGVLTGIVFWDGSSMYPDLPSVRRAGWSVVQVSPTGELQAAAYGPVPLAAGPNQTAPEAEDFACLMAARLVVGPARCFADCENTLKALRGGAAGTSVKPSSARCQIWSATWAALDPQGFSFEKTKAHATAADVHAGRTTWWELKEN